MAESPEYVTVSLIPVHDVIAMETPVPYPRPLGREWAGRSSPHMLDVRLFHYVFELPSPYLIPAFEHGFPEQEVVEGYIQNCIRLVGSRAQEVRSAFSFFQESDEHEPRVNYTGPTMDELAGFMAAFRLVCSQRLLSTKRGEPFNFDHVERLLTTEVSRAADPQRQSRSRQLRGWLKAHKRLCRFRLRHLAESRHFGKAPRDYEMQNFDRPSPRESIQLFTNAELLHNDVEKRARIKEWDDDLFRGKLERYRLIEAVDGLTYYYAAIAVLASRLIGRPELTRPTLE